MLPRPICFLVALACLAGCRTQPQLPRLSATVGQLDEATSFLAFIEHHRGQIVALDLKFPAGSFQGAQESESSSFDVWENCDDLAEGQQPSSLAGGCTGFEFIIPHAAGDAPLPRRDGSVWRLSGQFRIDPRVGRCRA